MIDQERANLEERISKSSLRKAAYEAHVLPYVKDAELKLFKAFCSTPASDVEQLQLIKMQHSVLIGLESSYISDIEDGIVANAELKSIATSGE
jgi:hypothetical protein